MLSMIHFLCVHLSGAHVNCRTTEGMTPLHFATYGGHVECVRLLLIANADVHATTRLASSFMLLLDQFLLHLQGGGLKGGDIAGISLRGKKAKEVRDETGPEGC